MFARITAKNVGDPFFLFWDTAYIPLQLHSYSRMQMTWSVCLTMSTALNYWLCMISLFFLYFI